MEKILLIFKGGIFLENVYNKGIYHTKEKILWIPMKD